MLKAFATATSVLCLAGTSVLLYFILLAGVRDSVPLNEVYWIQFPTTAISSSIDIPNPVRWTFYNYCGVNSEGHSVNCTSTSAAFPFTPQDAFQTTEGIPSDFIDHRNTYYYLTRIPYGFLIAVIFFVFLALVFSLISCCSRIGAGFVSFFSGLAFIFGAAAMAMLTAAYVKAKHQLHKGGIEATLGVKMFAFSWTIVALLLISWILMSLACCFGSSHNSRRRKREAAALGSEKRGWFQSRRKSSATAVPVDPVTGATESKSNRGFFNWSRKNDDQKNYASSFERIDPPAATDSSNPMSAGFFKTNRRRDNDQSSYYAENVPPHA